MMRATSSRALAGAASLLACASSALAQEAMYTQAATMPSPGVFVLRPEFHYWRFGAEPDGSASQTERFEWSTSLQAGLARDRSFTVDVPVAVEKREVAAAPNVWDRGVGDIDLYLKWRFFKDDTGGVDTLRAALLAGAKVASGDDLDFSSQTVNPHIGAVVTLVRGRHGFNQDFIFQLNTSGEGVDNLGGGQGPAEAFRANTSYLFRIFPDQFVAESRGAWYLTAELNTLYETNGDWDVRFSPGVMFEGWDFAFEVMAQLPILQELDNRAELDFGVGVGLRFTF